MNSFSSAEAVNPIVQVIHRDEQYVGFLLLCVEPTHYESKEGGNERFTHGWERLGYGCFFDKKSWEVISQEKEGDGLKIEGTSSRS